MRLEPTAAAHQYPRTEAVISGQEKLPVIVRTDGGICSQLLFYAYGLELEERGYDVYYDTSWYDEHGLDNDGLLARNYDLELAFPSIKTRRCDEAMLHDIRTKNTLEGALVSEVKDSAYLSGYPGDRRLMLMKFADFFRERFHPVDEDLCQGWLQKISTGKSCAIHVRRGDLATYSTAYGWPTSVEYFLKAIDIVKTCDKEVTFYFFSDGMAFVKDEILPKLSEDTSYEIVDSFGSDRGYLDLYLMTKMDYIIASQGSHGRIGRVLSEKNPLLIMPTYSRFMLENYPGCLYINDDVREEKSAMNRALAASSAAPAPAPGMLVRFKRFGYTLMLAFSYLPVFRWVFHTESCNKKLRKYS